MEGLAGEGEGVGGRECGAGGAKGEAVRCAQRVPVCVLVCLCVRERERENETERAPSSIWRKI